MPRPLDGVLVLEVGQYISAPYCGLVLADLGAEVIKIERPGSGDPRRHFEPKYTAGDRTMSSGFVGYNRNKKSFTLDLSQSEGAALFRRLVDKADVVVENLKPGSMERLGLGYDSLAETNPRLIYCAISGFGRLPDYAGPYTGQRSFDTTIQAMSGVMSVTGEPGGRPSLGPSAFADIYTGVYGALAINSALYGRERTGRGTFIDQAMYDTLVSLMERALILHALTGYVPRPGQDLYSPLGPMGAKDGTIAIVLPTDDMFRRFCKALGRPDLIDHPRLQTSLDRAAHFHDILRPEAEKWTLQHTRSEIMNLFVSVGLPVGVVQTVDEIYRCPQIKARDMLLDISEPAIGPLSIPRTPFLFSAFDPVDNRSAPALGQHTHEVLRSLVGMADDDIVALEASGVV